MLIVLQFISFYCNIRVARLQRRMEVNPLESIPAYYTLLFNRVSEAIAALEAHNYGQAQDILVHAQQEAEEHFIAEK